MSLRKAIGYTVALLAVEGQSDRVAGFLRGASSGHFMTRVR
jgi:hypothetical protein